MHEILKEYVNVPNEFMIIGRGYAMILVVMLCNFDEDVFLKVYGLS